MTEHVIVFFSRNSVGALIAKSSIVIRGVSSLTLAMLAVSRQVPAAKGQLASLSTQSRPSCARFD
jgi:hypothetical protein